MYSVSCWSQKHALSSVETSLQRERSLILFVLLKQADNPVEVLTPLCYFANACCTGHALSLLWLRTEELDTQACGGNVRDGTSVYNTGLFVMMIRIMVCLDSTSDVSLPLLPSSSSLPHMRRKIYG